MIQLTVGLPIWNSKNIAWLALESLCNQKNIDFDWELLIVEEQIEEFGIDNVKKFCDRLKKNRCVSIRYIPLDYRIPLPQKWKLMFKSIDKNSKIFLLQAADCYAESNRLRRTFEKAKEGYDWIQNRRGYYYSLHYKKVIEFDQSTFGAGCKTGLNMAVSPNILKNIPDSFQTSGIDNWLFKESSPKNVCWIDEHIPDGVDTDGLNNISFARRHNFYNPKKPFNKTDITIDKILPLPILEKLNKVQPR